MNLQSAFRPLTKEETQRGRISKESLTYEAITNVLKKHMTRPVNNVGGFFRGGGGALVKNRRLFSAFTLQRIIFHFSQKKTKKIFNTSSQTCCWHGDRHRHHHYHYHNRQQQLTSKFEM